MKTRVKTAMTSKVHYLLFVLACLLLAAVACSAKIMADRIAAEFDFKFTQAQSTTQSVFDV